MLVCQPVSSVCRCRSVKPPQSTGHRLWSLLLTVIDEAKPEAEQLQLALKKSTPLSKGYIGMLLLAVALVFLLRIRMAYAKLEKRGGKKGVIKKLKKDKDH